MSGTMTTAPARGRTLLQLSEDMQALDLLLEEREGDVTGIEEILDRWFAEVGDAVETKVDGYAALIREMELRAAVRKEEAERLNKRVKADAARVDFLKGRLKQFFESTGRTKVETERFTVAVQKNGGVIPMHIDVAPEELPELYRVEVRTVKANTELIRKELEAGTVIPGCTLGERGTSLRIR